MTSLKLREWSFSVSSEHDDSSLIYHSCLTDRLLHLTCDSGSIKQVLTLSFLGLKEKREECHHKRMIGQIQTKNSCQM